MDGIDDNLNLVEASKLAQDIETSERAEFGNVRIVVVQTLNTGTASVLYPSSVTNRQFLEMATCLYKIKKFLVLVVLAINVDREDSDILVASLGQVLQC